MQIMIEPRSDRQRPLLRHVAVYMSNNRVRDTTGEVWVVREVSNAFGQTMLKAVV